MSRIPIRVRLAAAFALAMGFILLLVFLILYFRLQSNLDSSIDNGLRSRSDDVAALVYQADSGLAQGSGATRLSEAGESFAQVLTVNGEVFDSTPGATRPALTPTETSSLSSPSILDNRQVSGIEGAARLLATPISAQGMDLILIVGTSTSEQSDALNGLLAAFLVGGPIAILLSSGLGYLLASAGLAPVEALRRQAELITLERGGERLPLPDAKDEVRRLGETLNAMLERLEESFARERAFVADAGHELRTPLAILRSELEVTLRNDQFDEETGAALRRAVEEVDLLARLAEDLLTVASVQEGELEIHPVPTDVRMLLESLVTRFSDRLATDGRTIDLDAPAKLVVPMDPLRIRQAVINLIDNALRHGGDPIVVRARRDEEFLLLEVQDNGPGIPEDFVVGAFERFTRLDQSRAGGGTGLGLAIVRAIVQAHGGDATIERVDYGARVCLRLPLSHPRHPLDLPSGSS